MSKKEKDPELEKIENLISSPSSENRMVGIQLLISQKFKVPDDYYYIKEKIYDIKDEKERDKYRALAVEKYLILLTEQDED